MKMDFYRAFEEKHRGSRELIKARMQCYLPFILAAKEIFSEPLAVDLGCGRGEWLELLGEHGFDAQGVDLDDGMLEASRELGLNVHTGDAIDFLKKLPDESQTIISGFHFAEHIPFDDLKILVEEALRSLKPAGLLILETPNPENIVVGATNFYIDPTHKRPLPPLLLSFLPEYYGFERFKILRLAEAKGISEKTSMSLADVFYGVSPDFAVVAQKSAAPELIAVANAAFDMEFGVTLDQLTTIYEQQTEVTNNRLDGMSGTLLKLEDATLAAHEAVIKEQQAHVDTLQTALTDAAQSQRTLLNEKARALVAHESIIKEQLAHVDTLQKSLKESNRRVEELAGQITLSKTYAELLNEQLEQKTQALSCKESELAELEIQSQNLQNECEVAEAKIAELNSSSHHWWTVTENLTRQQQSAEAKIAELNSSSHHWWTIATHLTHELQTVYNSKSWWLTHPLRELNKIIKEWPQRVRSSLKNGLKSFLKKPAIYLALKINKHPKIKKIAVAILQKQPRVDRKLRAVLTNHRFQILLQNMNTASNYSTSSIANSKSVNNSYLPLQHYDKRRALYVYVDHTVNCPTNTGVQRVTRNLANGFINLGGCVRFVKWDSATRKSVLINAMERKHLSLWGGPPITEEEHTIYREANAPLLSTDELLPVENQWLIVPEVTHITGHPEPVTLDLITWAKSVGLKVGFIFYDAIPLKFQEYKEMASKHSRYMQHLMLADLVWPISEWSARDLVSYWMNHEHAGSNTLPEVQVCLLSGESSQTQRITTIKESENLILSVGTIEPRKNQITLIRAFQAYRKKHPKSNWRLVLVGNLHPLVADEVNKVTKFGSPIQHLGHVSEKELESLYRSCAFTVFPSIDEGFGLPIIESLWYGKPCVCANFGAMEEVANDGGCLMTDTRNQKSLENAITDLIQDKNLRLKLSQEAVTRSLRTWDEYAESITKTLDKNSQVEANLGIIYYWIDHTLQYPKNTGVQRVCRQLARSLMEIGLRLTPVKWDHDNCQFIPPCLEELEHFSKWNGPAISMWHEWVSPSAAPKNSWFLMSELPIYSDQNLNIKLMDFVHKVNLHSLSIFFDAIPWKIQNLYSPEATSAHRNYMLNLLEYDLVLPISFFSGNDLTDFLDNELPRTQRIKSQIIPTPLPAEFSAIPRITNVSIKETEPYKVVSLGTVEPRKNHINLLEAFRLLKEKSGLDIQLTIVGRPDEPALANHVHQFIKNHSGITWEENADDNRINELLKECDFTVYQSPEEGFGLPILESLWYGKPCVCANFGAMFEVANGGGCVTVDVRDVHALANAIQELAENTTLRRKLAQEATTRPFKSWDNYAQEVAAHMVKATPKTHFDNITLPPKKRMDCIKSMILPKRPKLSICISTYNRAEWLSKNLENLEQLYPNPLDDVEFLICDNASTDNTEKIIRPFLNRTDFSYYRNQTNVGMLGNLRETAHYASGEYIWIVGDDDLLMPGSIEKVLKALYSKPEIALVYLNYAFTHIEDARTVTDFTTFFHEATPIVPAENDQYGPIHTICARNENFFTAIYTLVLRRDHALKAYSQETSGRPFSTMLTCIPTTYYVLNNMMDLKGLWIGQPQVVVNMNVSWKKYAPLWILERIPEVYDLAQKKGASVNEMDRWRCHTLPGVAHYFKEIFENDPLNNAEFFDPARLIRRFRHLPEFSKWKEMLREIYARAHLKSHPSAYKSPDEVFKTAHVDSASLKIAIVN